MRAQQNLDSTAPQRVMADLQDAQVPRTARNRLAESKSQDHRQPRGHAQLKSDRLLARTCRAFANYLGLLRGTASVVTAGPSPLGQMDLTSAVILTSGSLIAVFGSRYASIAWAACITLRRVSCMRRRKAALVLLDMNSGRFACKLSGIPSAKRQAARWWPPSGCGAGRLTALPGKGVTMQVLRGVRDSVLRSKPANLIRFMPA